MPRVNDDLRFAVRDFTIEHTLKQLGSKESLGAKIDFIDSANRLLNKLDPVKLPPAIAKQMSMARLFVDSISMPKAPSTSTSSRSMLKGSKQAQAVPAAPQAQEQYLLGQFDSLAVPVRADFNAAFQAIYGENASNAVNDCDGQDGFKGWFWVLYAAAPNIGESPHAEDFEAYSIVEPGASPVKEQQASNGEGLTVSTAVHKRLDEDLYIGDMGRLWRMTLLAMGELEVEDAIVFPFGMGAFLRSLADNDSSYEDPAKMRNLRRRIADAAMDAVADICITGQQGGGAAAAGAAVPKKGAAAPKGKQEAKAAGKVDKARAPARVHVCLVVANAESIENHNVFVEAAAARQNSCPKLKEVVMLHRNVDTMALASELAAPGNGPLAHLKVAILNGANRGILGNHWFEDGARFAIDENLHRRSASLSRAALLLNSSGEGDQRSFDPKVESRKPLELHDHVRNFGGRVVALQVPGLPGAKARGRPQSVSPPPARCGCFGRRRAPAQTAPRQPAKSAKGAAAAAPAGKGRAEAKAAAKASPAQHADQDPPQLPAQPQVSSPPGPASSRAAAQPKGRSARE